MAEERRQLVPLQERETNGRRLRFFVRTFHALDVVARERVEVAARAAPLALLLSFRLVDWLFVIHYYCTLIQIDYIDGWDLEFQISEHTQKYADGSIRFAKIFHKIAIHHESKYFQKNLLLSRNEDSLMDQFQNTAVNIQNQEIKMNFTDHMNSHRARHLPIFKEDGGEMIA